MAIMQPSILSASPADSSQDAQPSVRSCIAMTFGDPAGVGPELATKLLADPQNREKANIFVPADLREVKAAVSVAGVTIPIADVAGPDGVEILDDGSAIATPIQVGEVSKEADERVLHQLKRAVAMANKGEVDAIVFAPLKKTSLHMVGTHEEDELRWFAKYLKLDVVTSEINIIDGFGPRW